MHLHDERHFCYILESKGQQVVANQVLKVSVRLQMEFKDEYLNKTSKEFQNVQNTILQNVSMSVHNCYSKLFFLVFNYKLATVLFNMHQSHKNVSCDYLCTGNIFFVGKCEKKFPQN